MRIKVKKGSLKFYVEFESPTEKDLKYIDSRGTKKQTSAEQAYIEGMLLRIGDCLDDIDAGYNYKIEQH